MEAKSRTDASIAACIPALNEAGTIGPIVESIRRHLVDGHALVDEIVVMDSMSEDDTVRIAEDAGATVYQDAEILPGLEPASGKGEAMWKSLFVLKSDLIAWLDADIENFHPRFVYGPLAPLLLDRDISYVKAFYDRPMRHGNDFRPAEGGRVTELLARPLLNMFWPELAALIQPLSGEYAGRREALESIPFFTGYGVELGMLIALYEQRGIEAIAQVDLDIRVHRNQPLHALSQMSFAILQTALRFLDASDRVHVRDAPETLYRQLRKEGHDYALETRDIHIVERPPAASLPEYGSR